MSATKCGYGDCDPVLGLPQTGIDVVDLLSAAITLVVLGCGFLAAAWVLRD